MKVALGAAVAVTGASALVYILLRSRKRHPDPGKLDNTIAAHSENVSPSKTSEEPTIFKGELNASCSDMTCESYTEDKSTNKYPYVNFNGHVPVIGKNSERVDEVTDHSNEISVSVKESYVIEQHTEVCSENVTEAEVKLSDVNASSSQYSRRKNQETVMEYNSVVPLEMSDVEEKDGSIELSVSQNLEENENISMKLNIKEGIVSNTTVAKNFSSKPGMEKVTDIVGSFLEYDCHTTIMLTKEEEEPMKGSGMHNASIEKSAISTSGVNEESNVMSDSEQSHELSASLKLKGKEPSGLCDFILEKVSSVSPTIGRDQESVILPNLDLNKEDTCLLDISQNDSLDSSLSVQDEKTTESFVLHKEGESYISSSSQCEKHSTLLSNLEDEKQSSVSSNFEQEEQSPLSSSLTLEKESSLSLDMECGEKATEHSLHFSPMDEEQLVLSSCIDQLKHPTLSPILPQEKGCTLSSMNQEEQSSIDQEEHDTLSSTMLLEKPQSSTANFDQEECHNLSSSTSITCGLGNEDQSNLSVCNYQEQEPVSKEGSAVLLDETDQCSHSSCLNPTEQFSISSNSNTEDHSTVLFSEEEHLSCLSSKKHEEQPCLSSTLDQEEESAHSFNLAQGEEAVNLTQEEDLSQQEESLLSAKEHSLVLPSLVTEEQSTLSTTLDQNQESTVLLMKSDKLCAQAQETSKEVYLKSAKEKKEDYQKYSVLHDDEEIMSTSSEGITKERVAINCKKDNPDLHQKASELEEEEKLVDRTQNASMEISTVRENSYIGTDELEKPCGTATEMLRESTSIGTPKLRNNRSIESGKVREGNCTSVCIKESSVEINNLKESNNTGIVNLEENNITDTSELNKNNNAGNSKLRESSNTAPSKLRDSNIMGTNDLEESNTLKKTAVSDKGTLRKQFQENQRDSAAADLDHDSTSEQENVNSDSMSVKSFDSSEIEPETLFNPSTFPVSSQEQYIFYEFEIPQTLVGRLIGKKGAFVNKIKATTDATVIVYPHKNRRIKLCSVEGTKQQVRVALDMIREHFPQNRYPDVTLAQVSTQPTVLTPAQPTLNTQAMQIELTSGVVVEVRVSAVVSAGELWVQQPLHPSFSALHRLQSCMNLNYGEGSNTPPLPSPVQDGTVCVAQIKKHWLRCQVLSTENDISLVVLLDVGGTVSIATSLLRQIRYDYMTLPFQATQCFLHGIQPAKDDVWDDVSSAVMEELVSDTILFATVVSYTEDGVPLVNLYRRDQDQYVHLNEKLVLLGHAQWVSQQPSS